MRFELIEKKNKYMAVNTNKVTSKDVVNSIIDGSINLVNDAVKGLLTLTIPVTMVVALNLYINDDINSAKTLLGDMGNVFGDLYGLV